MNIIYLDNASTTKVYGEVVKEMNRYMALNYGNPSSAHQLGEDALNAINRARRNIAFELGCKAEDIVFTSGATESNNIALQGFVKANKVRKIFISAIEHSSVYETAMELKKKGIEVIEIPVDKEGILDIKFIEKNVRGGDFVSVIYANNEIGSVQNIKKIGEVCRKRKAVFHTDAVQSFCKEKIKVNEMNIDLLSASAHKIHGSKGIGLLFVKNGIKLRKRTYGGEQELGLRAGTENVPAIMGFAKALELINKVNKERIKNLRDYFIERLEEIGGKINGSKEKRLYNHVSVCFSNIDTDELVIKLSIKGIICSTRSACLSKQKKGNRILRAIGLSDKEANGSVRFVLDEWTTKKDVDYVIQILKSIIN